MFELLDRPVLSDLTDAALIDALECHTRAEAVAAADRLAVIGEIVARHCDDEDDTSAHCAIDGWETAAAAISAACNLGRKAASTQMRIAQTLRQRLPQVAAVFARGDISAKDIATITWRTQNITDDDAWALIDTALAGAATSYGALSNSKTEQAIDVWIEKFDPAAVRKTRTAARDRDICFGDPDDPLWRDEGARRQLRPRVPVRLEVLDPPLTRAQFAADPRLERSEILRVPRIGNPAALTPTEWLALEELVGAS